MEKAIIKAYNTKRVNNRKHYTEGSAAMTLKHKTEWLMISQEISTDVFIDKQQCSTIQKYVMLHNSNKSIKEETIAPHLVVK